MKTLRYVLSACLITLVASCSSENSPAPEAQPVSPRLSVPGKSTNEKIEAPSAPKKIYPVEKKLVGTWQGKNDEGDAGTMELTKDGKFIARLGDSEMNGEYNVLDNETMEYGVVMAKSAQTLKVKVKVEGDTLTIKDQAGRESTFTRINK